jgi:low temperature requirement protein LtrA
VIQGADALKSPGTAQSFLNYAPAAAIAPALIFIGSLLPYGPRLTVWIVAGLLFVASALAGGRRDHEWAIDPVHFSERHALFVIISLGEVLVAIGTTAADTAGGAGLNTATAFAVLASLATASVIWWSYFAFVPTVLEQRLRLTEISGRGRIARDVFSFGHFPIVSGIIAYAVVAKHLVQRPSGLLTTADRTLLLASAVLFVGGLMNLQWRCARTVAWYRAAAIGISLVPFALAGSATGVIVVALQASILGAMAIAASHRFRDMSFSSYPAGKTTKD